MRALVWVSLIPFSWCLTARRSASLYFGLFLGGLLCHLIGLDFIRTASAGRFQAGWLAAAFVGATGWVFAAFVDAKVLRSSRVPMGVRLPIVWIAMEFARVHLVGLVLRDPLPFMQLGSLAAPWPLVTQVADLGGVFAVTWSICAVNGGIFDAGYRRLFMPPNAEAPSVAGIRAALVIVPATVLYGAWRLSQPAPVGEVEVALVNSEIPSRLDAEFPKAIKRAAGAGLRTVHGSRKLPSLFVWPEGACRRSIYERADEPTARDHVQEMEALSMELRAPILVGCDRLQLGPLEGEVRRFNSVAFVSPRDGLRGFYDKVCLVPWREFQPPVATALRVLPLSPAGAFQAGQYSRGDHNATFELLVGDGKLHFGTAICYEVAHSALHRGLALPDHPWTPPDFYIGVADESAFEGQQYAILSADAQQLRAIECRRAYRGLRGTEFPRSSTATAGSFVQPLSDTARPSLTESSLTGGFHCISALVIGCR